MIKGHKASSGRAAAHVVKNIFCQTEANRNLTQANNHLMMLEVLFCCSHESPVICGIPIGTVSL